MLKTKYLPSAVNKSTIKNLLNVASKSPFGCFVEVGVYQGGTASYLTELAKYQKRKIFLYDTFCGIPFQDVNLDKHKKRDFSDVNFNFIKNKLKYANIIKGTFPESAVHMTDIAFVHLDVDQYKSYYDCIKYFFSKMKKGGIIWFDDYGLKGCKEAINQLLNKKKIIILSGQAYTVFE